MEQDLDITNYDLEQTIFPGTSLCPGSTKVKPNNDIIILFIQSDKL